MPVVKDPLNEKIEETRKKGLEVALNIIAANQAPSNQIQIECIKTALEMFKTFSVKA